MCTRLYYHRAALDPPGGGIERAAGFNYGMDSAPLHPTLTRGPHVSINEASYFGSTVDIWNWNRLVILRASVLLLHYACAKFRVRATLALLLIRMVSVVAERFLAHQLRPLYRHLVTSFVARRRRQTPISTGLFEDPVLTKRADQHGAADSSLTECRKREHRLGYRVSRTHQHEPFACQ